MFLLYNVELLCAWHRRLTMKITRKITAFFLISAIIISAFSFGATGAEPVNGSDVAAYARQFEGCAYQHSCKGPDKFDCSGLVYYVLRNFGITFGAGTSEYNTPQKAKAFGKVIESMDDAQAGDIVVWNSHAGVYLGEGKCISAMNSRKGVTIIGVEIFVDQLGIRNPYHFFIRPFGYAEETSEEVEDTTTPNPDENTGETDGTEESAPSESTLNLFEFFITLFVRITELIINQFLTSPVATAVNFIIR